MSGVPARRRSHVRLLAVALGLWCAAAAPAAQQTPLDRLPTAILDVTPPGARVRGRPGEMAVQARPCRAEPSAGLRRRIVDVAAQEWGFFGFRIVDRTEIAPRVERASGILPAPARVGGVDDATRSADAGGRRRARFSPEEAGRVATSIAGYWAVTPEGAWIVGRQNDEWKGPDGIAARWNAPWSAAFISWVMCEAGLETTETFQRAVAHHAYIDQAIRARDGRAPRAAYVAYDVGEAAIAPGDMLCSSRRPVYRTLAERRRQMGVGARTHCDIVVKVDERADRILVIGGNVRGTVSLKLLRAEREPGRPLGVMDPDEERPIFAHLQLRAGPVASDALDRSPTARALGCVPVTPVLAAAANAAPARGTPLPARC
jgi:hypothetical protein